MAKNTKMVTKDNALINATYTLNLVEQRLILLAISEARSSGKGINTESFLEIHAQDYARQFGIKIGNTYDILSKAALSLFHRQVTYMAMDTKRQKPEKRIVRWVSGISYVEDAGLVKIRFAPEVVTLITELERHFTSYDIEQVANLSSSYAVRLYELLIAWRSTGKTPIFELEDFRNKLGLASNEYMAMCHLKSRVLDLAIKQINDHTDISAEYEQHKRGRTITGFSFSFKQKSLTKKPEAAKRGRKLKESSKVATPSEMDVPTLPPKARKRPERSAADMLKTVLAKQ